MSRRARGAGSIIKKGGRYYLLLWGVCQKTGEKKRNSFPLGPSLREATRKADELIFGSMIMDRAKKTFYQWLNYWLETQMKGCKKGTKRTYSSLISNHIVEDIGHIKLFDLNPYVLQRFIARMQRKNTSGTVISSVVRLIKAALNYAVRQQILNSNPAIGLKLPKFETKEKVIFTQPELNALVDKIRQSEYKFPLLFSVFCGLRRGEALGIKWDVIDLKQKRVLILKQITVDGICSPKSRTSNRRLQLPDVLIKELEQVKKKHRTGFLFKGNRNPQRMLRHFKQIAAEIGYPEATIHDLRHSHASILLSRGVPPAAIQSQLGHIDVSTTLRRYSHSIPSEQVLAARKIDELFNQEADQQ